MKTPKKVLLGCSIAFIVLFGSCVGLAIIGSFLPDTKQPNESTVKVSAGKLAQKPKPKLKPKLKPNLSQSRNLLKFRLQILLKIRLVKKQTTIRNEYAVLQSSNQKES